MLKNLLFILALGYTNGYPTPSQSDILPYSALSEVSTTNVRLPGSEGNFHQVNNSTGTVQYVINIFGGKNIFHANGVPAIDEQTNTSTSEPATFRTIRSDYAVTMGIGAHKLHKVLYTWTDAHRTCAKEGGHLAVINSEAEAILIQRMLSNIRSSPWPWAWIGVHSMFEQGEWITVHDQALEQAGWQTWHVGEPNNNEGTKTCVYVETNGFGLANKKCSYPMWFICEIALNNTNNGR